MKLIGLVRLGRDAELRFTAGGEPVASVTGAYNYGRKGEEGFALLYAATGAALSGDSQGNSSVNNTEKAFY